MAEKRLAFVIPARNEEALIGEVLEAILGSIAAYLGAPREGLRLESTPFEVVVVDAESEDLTPEIVDALAETGVSRLVCPRRGSAAARNDGVSATRAPVLCFVDADTIVPEEAVRRILEHHEEVGRRLVLYRLVSREPGLRAWLWWTFWGLSRRLPIARAKAMPAFMSCTRQHFEQYGPFREDYFIGEEWPLTTSAYRLHREHFLCDQRTTGRTSSRRMELQRFGYLRTFLKWVGVVLFPWARTSLDDRIRHERASTP